MAEPRGKRPRETEPEEPTPFHGMPRVQWFPGHIAKATKILQEQVKLVDMVIELVDARLPYSSRFLRTRELIGDRPRALVLNKRDMADPALTEAWIARYRDEGVPVVAVDSRTGHGFSALNQAIAAQGKRVQERMASRGRLPRAVRLMVVGMPNVGKSSLINRVVRTGKARTGDRPGVTRGTHWIRISKDLELLDTPGIIPPKLDDPRVALRIAMVGSVSTESYDALEVARWSFPLLDLTSPDLLAPWGHPASLETFARKRGMLLPGDRPDLGRAARTWLADLRTGALGSFTLDLPGQPDLEIPSPS